MKYEELETVLIPEGSEPVKEEIDEEVFEKITEVTKWED